MPQHMHTRTHNFSLMRVSHLPTDRKENGTWVNSYTNPSFKLSWSVLSCRPSCKPQRCFSGAVIDQVYERMTADLMSSSKKSFSRGLELSWQYICSRQNSLFTLYICCSVACGILGMSVACLPHRCGTQGSKKLSMSEILQGVESTGNPCLQV